jgi:hypothetical protein
MSLQVLYSFDHLNTVNLPLLPDVVSIGPGCSVAAFSGRDNGGCLMTTDLLNTPSGVNFGFNVALEASPDYTVGAWVTMEGPPAGSNAILMAFGNPSVAPPAVGDKLSSLVVFSDGSLSIWSGEPGVAGGNSLGVLTPAGTVTFGTNESHYIEYHVKIGPAGVGVIHLTVDGVVVAATPQVTNGLGVPTMTHAMFGNPAGCPRTRFDDIYVMNNAVDNGDGWATQIKGVVQVDGKLVNAAGDLAQWAPTTPTGINFQNVNEPIADLTTFNTASAIGVLDLYNVEDVTYIPIAVQADLFMRKTTSGPASVSPVTRLVPGGANFVAAAKPLTTQFKYHKQVYGKAPDATAWTTAKYNALQVGVLKAE